jgi:hypothetical protein
LNSLSSIEDKQLFVENLVTQITSQASLGVINHYIEQVATIIQSGASITDVLIGGPSIRQQIINAIALRLASCLVSGANNSIRQQIMNAVGVRFATI